MTGLCCFGLQWNQTVIDSLNDNIIRSVSLLAMVCHFETVSVSRLGGDMVKVMQALTMQTSALNNLQKQLSRLVVIFISFCTATSLHSFQTGN